MSNAALATDDMSLFEPPPKKEPTKTVLGIRVEKTLKADIAAVEKLWKALAEAKDLDADDIDMTYVCTRLLRHGVDTAFAEFGGRPTSEEDWKRVLKQIAKNVRPDKP